MRFSSLQGPWLSDFVKTRQVSSSGFRTRPWLETARTRVTSDGVGVLVEVVAPTIYNSRSRAAFHLGDIFRPRRMSLGCSVGSACSSSGEAVRPSIGRSGASVSTFEANRS